jgi:hypothetical protein
VALLRRPPMSAISSADQVDWSQLLTSQTADAVLPIVGSISLKVLSRSAALFEFFVALEFVQLDVGGNETPVAKCINRDMPV